MEPRDAVTHCTVFETEACFNPMFMGAILFGHLTVSQLYPKDRVMVGSVYSFYCYSICRKHGRVANALLFGEWVQQVYGSILDRGGASPPIQ